MAPALLFCPSSSAVQLLGQVSPSKSLALSSSHGSSRKLAHTHWSTESLQKAVPSSSFAGKCREKSYPLALRSIYAAASVEEPPVLDVSPAESLPIHVGVDENSNTEPKSVGRKAFSRSKRAITISSNELVSGATFIGKVTTIQPFGAFIDFGAFTNGLVHISRLRKGFVKKVEDVVQLGQDVNVQVLDVDLTSRRISLMLVEEGSKEDTEKDGEVAERNPQDLSQQQNRGPRRDTSRHTKQSSTPKTTMKKGELATGIVRNIIRGGVFLTLPDGTDGYLPVREIVFKTPSTNLEAQFQVGQEVHVKILRLEKGRVTLTMKQEVDYAKINEDLNKDVVAGATNPFEIAFRGNALIASFLADRDKQKDAVDILPEESPSAKSNAEHHVNGVEEILEEKPRADDSKTAESSVAFSMKDTPTAFHNDFSQAELAEIDEGIITSSKEDTMETSNSTDASLVAANAEQS